MKCTSQKVKKMRTLRRQQLWLLFFVVCSASAFVSPVPRSLSLSSLKSTEGGGNNNNNNNKRRRRRKTKAASPPKDKEEEDLASLIVDEPGKLLGTSLSQARKKKPLAPPEEKTLVDGLKRSVETNFGKRPQDASDAFDYGVGNLIKQTIYALSAALIFFDLYLNSPFFQRQAPSPVVTAISEELKKNQPVTDD